MPSTRRQRGVTPRPRAGRAYGSGMPSRRWEDWGKIDYPGGRALWCRLVIGFTIVTVVGAIFIVIGAVFFEEAQRIHEESGISLAMTWCVIGIVCGSLLMISSVVLGRMIISDKWRKNEQPTYPPSNPSRQNRVQHADIESTSLDEPSSPPPYAERNSPLPPPTAVFLISGSEVNLALPVMTSNNLPPPPRYIYDNSQNFEPEVSEGITPLSLPKYSEDDPCKLPIYGEDAIKSGKANETPKESTPNNENTYNHEDDIEIDQNSNETEPGQRSNGSREQA